MPEPAFVRPNAPPPIAPPTVRVLALTVTVGLAPRVTGPVPRFRLLDPVKVKLPFQVWGLPAVNASGPPLVLLRVPPLMTRLPVLREVALVRFRVPAPRVVGPLKSLAPVRVR